MSKLRENYSKYYKFSIIIIDLIIINIAYILSFLIRYQGDLPEFNFTPYINALPFITIAAILYFDLFGMLSFYKKTVYDIIKSIIGAVFLLAVTTVTITYFLQGFSFPRSILVITPILQIILLSIWKTILLRIRQKAINTRIVMLIGDIEEVRDILDKVKQVMKNDKSNIKYIFDPTQIETIMKRLKDVDEVFLCTSVNEELRKEIITRCMGRKQVIYLIPRLFEISLLNTRLIQFSDIPAFMIDNLDLTEEQKIFKRLLDFLFAFFCLVVFLPLMLLIAILIKLTSRGPVLYTQERVTRGNKIFSIYKFRTMYEGAENDSGPVLSDSSDPRVTSVGRILRRTRLDELPQLFNVLSGSMSIVGPRPERPYFVEQFSADIPEYTHRYTVKAGITGYAQVLGSYDTSPSDKLSYDLMYIKNYSLLLDIKLILQTIKVVFAGSPENKSPKTKKHTFYPSIHNFENSKITRL